MESNAWRSKNIVVRFSPGFEPTVDAVIRSMQLRQFNTNLLSGVDMDHDSLPVGLEKYGHEIDTLPYMGVISYNHD